MNKVSVVIPCRNEENYISFCLNSFIASDFPKDCLEILVVDGESTDNTISMVNSFSSTHPFIRLINNPEKVTPTALNLGIRNAKHDYILIASAHAEFPSNYIKALMVYIEKLKCDGVGGQLITDVKLKTKKATSIIRVLSNKYGVGNSMFRIGVSAPTKVDTIPFGLYKKELFNEVGYYDETLIRNHDIEWSKRLLRKDKKLYLIPEVSCTYYARETYKAVAKNNYKNGLWNILAVYITHNTASLSLRHFIPLFFILSLIVPALLSLLYWPFIFVSIASALAHFVLLLSVSFGLNDKATSISYLLKAFYTLHISYGFGSLTGLFRIDKLFLKK